MDTRIAVWLAREQVGLTVSESLKMLEALAHKECTGSMYARYHDAVERWKGESAAGDVSDGDILTYLQNLVTRAKASIAFWDSHPRDINARFFARECRKYESMAG